jgi:hypothetical protein
MRNLTTGFFRVMAMQETGEECCVRESAVRGWEDGQHAGGLRPPLSLIAYIDGAMQ